MAGSQAVVRIIMKLCKLRVCRVAWIAVFYTLFAEVFGAVVPWKAVVVGEWTSAARQTSSLHQALAPRVPLGWSNQDPCSDPSLGDPNSPNPSPITSTVQTRDLSPASHCRSDAVESLFPGQPSKGSLSGYIGRFEIDLPPTPRINHKASFSGLQPPFPGSVQNLCSITKTTKKAEAPLRWRAKVYADNGEIRTHALSDHGTWYLSRRS